MNRTVTHSSTIRVLAGAGIAAAALGAASVGTATASPSMPGEAVTVYADLDGNAVVDPVTLATVEGGAFELTTTIDGTTYQAGVGDGTQQPLVDPRPVDVNSDGVDEVLVPEFVGANTLTFHVWAYDPTRGLYEITTPDGAPLAVYEGGGVAASSGYECPADHDGRTLDLVSGAVPGSPDPDDLRYDGERVTYDVRGGVAGRVHVTPFTGVTRDDPVIATDPATCAPAS